MALEKEKFVMLKSNDDKVFKVEKNVVMAMSTMKHLLQDCGDDDDTTIPLQLVNSVTLDKVIKYCEHYKGNPPSTDENTATAIEGWDGGFIDIPQSELFELILAANFLGVNPLLNLACKRVAEMLSDKDKTQIRKTFNIVNDFTAEEEEEVRKENAWIEDPSNPV